MDDKIKYYAALSYMNARPLLKAKLFEYCGYDIERLINVNESELIDFSEVYNIKVPENFYKKISGLDIEKCYKDAFLDEEVKLLTFDDEKYPPLLKEIPDFPLSLYYKGDFDNIDYNFNLSVVGSRNATQGAKNVLNSLIRELDKSNITIVSGLAYGIDTQAHLSAIENNLKTIAVIGSGLDIIYPASNKGLYEKIKNGCGLIFSEFPLKTQPLSYNFPQRNRIIAGLSKGILIAEAGIKSGAMISARLALDYNREVMCIPGNVLNPNTEGIYRLIKEGAGIVVEGRDLLNYLNWDIILNDDIGLYEQRDLNDFQREVFDIIAKEPKTLDEVVQLTKEEVSKVMVTLTELELKSLIKQSNNKYYKI